MGTSQSEFHLIPFGYGAKCDSCQIHNYLETPPTQKRVHPRTIHVLDVSPIKEELEFVHEMSLNPVGGGGSHKRGNEIQIGRI